MKKIYLFAAVAAMFAACSSNDILEDDQNVAKESSAQDVAVGFEAYQSRNVTRAGLTGDLTLANLKKPVAEHGGFGVFGYYTDNNEYDPQSMPNFMYNQLVTWKEDGSSGYWVYDPIKYWPNEYGNNASSDDQDKVSFFAYAPYVEVNPNTGKVTDAENNKGGIVALSRNSANGDPLVKYVASFNADEIVDLCWGVNAATSSWALTQGGSQTLTTGLPWLNVERPYDAKAQTVTDQQRVKFTFNHALAKLNVQIDVDPDVAVHDATTGLDAATKVYVRSVSFSGIAMKGSLNLNNSIANTAEWLDYNGTGDLETGEVVTIYDGRKDGKEGTLNATASNEKQTGLYAQLIQTENGTETGVTHELQNLFASGSVYVIPTGETVEVEIVYDVETEDSNLGTYLSDGKTPGSSIENRIKKTITFGGTTGGFKSGNAYTLNLHLGMNSVKFDAEVANEWTDVADPNDAWLPANVPQYMAGTDAEYNLVLPAATTSYTFGITGLGASETLTPTPTSPVTAATVTDGAGTSNQSNAAGSALVEATITANTTTVKTTTGNVKVAGSSKSVQLNIIQEAAPLGLNEPSLSSNTFTFTVTATGVTDLSASGITVSVKKNGSDVASTDYTKSGMTIQMNSAPSSGEVYTFTIEANDAPAETVTFTVGS
ncbi:MAG: fimbrillin family protein [Prevotella sp.]|nr:fimbrillin family protein [Prevotella sp.]